MKAYVLIEARTGSISNVVHDLRRLEHIRQAEMTFGPYDIVAEVEAKDLDEMGRIIGQEIQTIDGVIETMTCLSVHVD